MRTALPPAAILTVLSTAAALRLGGTAAGQVSAPWGIAGAPSFTERIVPTDPNPRSLAVGQANHDPRPDLMAISVSSGNYRVVTHLGTGAGAFGPALATPLFGTANPQMAIGLLDGDAVVDLVTCDEPIFDVSTRFGLGDGTFGPPTQYGLPWSEPYAHDARIGDLNLDGMADVAIGHGFFGQYGVATLVAQSPGSLVYTDKQSGWSWTTRVEIGDLDGDGLPDVTGTDGDLRFYAGLGNGKLSPAVLLYDWDHALGLPGNALDHRLADVDGDGALDVVVSVASKGAGVLFFAGPLGLVRPVFTLGLPTAYNFALADLNGDGFLDYSVQTSAGGKAAVVVSLGSGTGHFSPGSPTPVGLGANSTVAADFDLDGKLDLATSNSADATISILIQD